MSFQDVAAIVSAWLLGVFTHVITNDSSARALCRIDLLEFENIFEELALQLCNLGRSAGSDASKAEEIKQMLRRLDVNQAGLFIKHPVLKEIIDQSLGYIWRIKKNLNDQSACSAVSVDLLMLWGEGIGHDYKAKKIREIRSFLDANFLARIYMRFQPRKWKNMIIKIIKRYVRGFVGAIVLLIASWIFAYYVKKILSNHISTISYLFELFAIVMIATSLYGKLGWEIQTWHGDSREEKANRLIFDILSSLSYFLATTVLFLKQVN